MKRVLIFVLVLTSCMNKTTTQGNTEGVGTKLPAAVTTATHGMVASDAALAAQVGTDVLKAGGNAIDAAVATAFALAVVYPEAGNIGGGGFLVAHFANGESAALDFREVAPGKATRDMYVDEAGNVTEKSLTGHLASGVPGAVAGLWEAHRKYGSKPWQELLQPAIGLAQNGFIVNDHLSRSIANDNRLARFPATAKLLLRDGKAPAAGTRFDNPDLAATLRRIAERGRDGFYKGETADLIVAEMERGGGLISHSDLEQYQPKWREPIRFRYRGHDVISMAPASSGGITIALMANILNGYDLRKLGATSPQRYHLIAEASRRAFADRNHFLGDPDFVQVPTAMLLSEQYAQGWRRTIAAQATPSSEIRAGAPKAESTETTHFSVVDAQGNAVGLTTTINDLYGSAVTVAGAGFLLNDEMDDFTSKVGVPNMFGLVQGEANSIVPGKRMLSAMTPTIVLDRAGRPLLITGARGGPRIISAVFQIMSNVLDHDMKLPEAVTRGRIHHQHLPDQLFYEQGALSEETLNALRQLNHNVMQRGAVGAAPTILRVGGVWTGMADPRGGGDAIGY